MSTGLGYYRDVDPFAKTAPEDAATPAEESEEEAQPQSKWDWVQEARSGGPSKDLKPKDAKPAFQRGFIDEVLNLTRTRTLTLTLAFSEGRPEEEPEGGGGGSDSRL